MLFQGNSVKKYIYKSTKVKYTALARSVFILLGRLLCLYFYFIYFAVTLGRRSGREPGDQKKIVLFF